MLKKVQRNKAEDLKKLAGAFFKNLEISTYEFGGVGLNPKRPFGNSDACNDICNIIGWDMEGNDGNGSCYADYQLEYAHDLYHRNLIPYLRKAWLSTMEPQDVAEAEVRGQTRDDAYKAKMALNLADGLFDALHGKNAESFFTELNYFQRKWSELRG